MKTIEPNLLLNRQDNLPDDIVLLQQLLVKQDQQIETLQSQLQQQTMLLDKLQGQIEQLLRQLYGKKSEKGIPKKKDAEDPVGQNPEPQGGKQRTGTTERKGGGRQRLPAHLPRERIEYTLEPDERGCPDCHAICKRMGEAVSEQLDFVPAQLVVKQHVRYK